MTQSDMCIRETAGSTCTRARSLRDPRFLNRPIPPYNTSRLPTRRRDRTKAKPVFARRVHKTCRVHFVRTLRFVRTRHNFYRRCHNSVDRCRKHTRRRKIDIRTYKRLGRCGIRSHAERLRHTRRSCCAKTRCRRRRRDTANFRRLGVRRRAPGLCRT